MQGERKPPISPPPSTFLNLERVSDQQRAGEYKLFCLKDKKKERIIKKNKSRLFIGTLGMKIHINTQNCSIVFAYIHTHTQTSRPGSLCDITVCVSVCA